MLGLDHPLVAVRDLERARDTYLSLGFRMKPAGRHPWGTSTALVIFHRQLLELVSVWDRDLLSTYPAGDFLFGRHVADHLAQREGVALSALQSDDAMADAAAVAARGGTVRGRIDFGRDVTRDDGTPDRTSTTLAVFTRDGLPRLSMFACQQHRRDLIEFPEWMDHPNGAIGFASATILAEDQAPVRDWMAALHGADAITGRTDGFNVQTAKGAWRVRNRQGAEALFGPLPQGLAADGAASVISLDILADLPRLRPFLSTFAVREVGGAVVLPEHDRLGGILLSFVQPGA
ncbi:VOC family protein [Falsirhodobacter sp. 20TX0035]|uniref:VOC family protein n=1 Tax=Falsirhodobacter sp. 20TX0035 TaxID=3022019 RepID=UPI00232F4D92|nr:VOC family protein [Falsirhodobacter sp. 20TX0035]MDB6452275.1 VOC family protein [Falsirhodobacter sp. 20TX0035]